MIRNIISVALATIFSYSAFAAGTTIALNLSKEIESDGHRSCFYVDEVNLGTKSQLTTFQVYSKNENVYRMQQIDRAIIENKDGTFSTRLAGYEEVSSKDSCPKTSEVLLVK